MQTGDAIGNDRWPRSSKTPKLSGRRYNQALKLLHLVKIEQMVGLEEHVKLHGILKMWIVTVDLRFGDFPLDLIHQGDLIVNVNGKTDVEEMYLGYQEKHCSHCLRTFITGSSGFKQIRGISETCRKEWNNSELSISPSLETLDTLDLGVSCWRQLLFSGCGCVEKKTWRLSLRKQILRRRMSRRWLLPARTLSWCSRGSVEVETPGCLNMTQHALLCKGNLKA